MKLLTEKYQIKNLIEKLLPYDREKLQKEINTDPFTNKLVNLPLNQLSNTSYKYIDPTNSFGDKTILDILNSGWIDPNYFFISESDNGEIIGIISFKRLYCSTSIIGILMLSFKTFLGKSLSTKENYILLRDTQEAFEKIMNDNNITNIQWQSHVENPCNRLYKKIIEKYRNLGMTAKYTENGNSVFYYIDKLIPKSEKEISELELKQFLKENNIKIVH